MITLHHLEYSQSFRILWLLEELDAQYELKTYDRDPETRLAPRELKELSPLGTAPVITTESGAVMAESNAIIDFVIDRYPDSTLRPEFGNPLRGDYLFWFHAGTGSLMPMQFMNGILTVMTARTPALLRPVVKKVTGSVREMLVQPRMKAIFDHMERHLGNCVWLAGDEFTAADIALSYSIFSAEAQGRIGDDRPNIQRWLEQARARPSFKSATAKDGRDTMVFSF